MKKQIIKRIIIATLGALLLCFGIGASVKINIGCDPLSMVFDGLHKQTNLSVGACTNIINIFIFLLIFILDRRNIGIATFVYLAVSNWLVNIGYKLFPQPSNIIISIILLIVMEMVIALGSELMIFAKLGSTPYDGLTMGIGKRLNHKVKFVYIRWTCDLIALVIGLILKAQYGIGTFISLIGIGLFMKMWQKLLEDKVNDFIKK